MDEQGDLYMSSRKLLSTFDRNYGIWKYSLGTSSIEQLVFSNNDQLDYSGLVGMCIIGSDIYVCQPFDDPNGTKKRSL